MRANERRLRLWQIVFRRKNVSVQRLAEELEVSTRTIKYDLAYMSVAYPIETVRGRYGGCVRLEDCNSELQFPLTSKQIDFLFGVWGNLNGSDAIQMWEILTILTAPMKH